MKEQKETKQTPAAAGPKLVRVSVKKAVSLGGVVYRPAMKGNEVEPVNVIVTEDMARMYTEDRVKILGPAPEDATVGLADPARPA